MSATTKHHTILGAITLGLSLACGGGGAGTSTGLTNSGITDNASAISALSKTETGVFLDSAVAGLSYKTDTLSGTTDSNGIFYFKSGETVIFSIGETTLGTTTGANTVTPAELFSVDPNSSDRRLVNALRLLQSLDEDADPDNGIQIPEAFQKLQERLEINFDVELDDFTFSENLQKFLDASPRQLVEGTHALDHFKKTLERKNNPGADELQRPQDFESPEAFIASRDQDTNGELSESEFVLAASDNLIAIWNEHFTKLDTDLDLSVSLTEWELRRTSPKQKSDSGNTIENFNLIDADQSSGIDNAEWISYKKSKYESHQKERFVKWDTDANASLTLTELQAKPKHDSTEHQEELVDRLDVDNDDLVSAEEFILEVPTEKQELAKTAFAKMDTDKDGFLSTEEIRPNPKKDAKEKREQSFVERDLDSSGTLSLEEFLAGVPEDVLDKARAHFAKIDTDANGDLSLEETKGLKKR